MSDTLGKGGNRALTGGRATARVHTAASVDVSAVLLTPDGKARADTDLVFFNHPEQDGVRVRGRTVEAELDRLPDEVASVVCVASIDTDEPGGRFDAASTPEVTVECGAEKFSFTPPPLTAGETVLLLVEFYRRGGGWKVRALGQGYADGLAGLATDFGIVVDDDGRAADTPAPPTTVPAPAAARVLPAAPAPLGKVELTKAGTATISLDKRDPDVVVTAELRWDGGTRGRRAADLDLYALHVPASAVRQGLTARDRLAAEDAVHDDPSLGAVYWNHLGDLRRPPYLRLDGDAQEPGQETVRIRRPDEQGYVLVCAYSALGNGVGSFKSFGAKAVVSDGRGSTVTVPLFSRNANAYWVAIALVDFTDPSGVRITQVEKYSSRHSENRPVLYPDGVFRMDRGPAEFKD